MKVKGEVLGRMICKHATLFWPIVETHAMQGLQSGIQLQQIVMSWTAWELSLSTLPLSLSDVLLVSV
jgi:hypothetical protein